MDKIDIQELAKGITKGLKESELFDVKELEASLIDSKLDFTKKYDKPIPLISMIEDFGKKRDVLTTANISCTMGGAKSKKTFFATMLIGSLLGYHDFAIAGNLQGLNVVLFDTEQAQYHVQKISNRLKTMLQTSLTSIDIFALRPYMPEKRCAIIDHYLKVNKGKYSFVIIDGIVDLMYDFNDLKESKTLATKLMEWTANYNCHINTILHTNKDQAYARGHLGSELMNKSETVFRITKEDDNSSVISCEMSRNAGFNDIRFCIDDHGMPVRNEMPSGFYDNAPGNFVPQELVDYSAGLDRSDIPF
jgi:hypothetical protein